MNKWYVIEDKGNLTILNEEEAKENGKATTILEYLKYNALDNVDATFYNYLSEYPQFNNEIKISVEEIYSVLEKAEKFLNGLGEQEVFEELSQYDDLDLLFRSEAKELVKNALIKKSEELLKQANEL